MTGIILIFHNRESQIDKNEFAQFLKKNKNAHLCLVNNGSTDHTIEVLHQLEQLFPSNISIIDLKVKRENDFALRNGFRFLMRNKNIDRVSFTPDINLKQSNDILNIVKNT